MEEEDAELQEAIRRSMDDYHAMHAVRGAPAYTLWSPGTPVVGTSSTTSSVQLRQQPQRAGFHMASQPQQQPQHYRYQTYLPPLHSQQQLISPSSSVHQDAGGGATVRGAVGPWEEGGGAHTSSFPATVVHSSSSSSSPSQLRNLVDAPPVSPAFSPVHPPLRSEAVSSSPFASRSVAVANPTSPATPFAYRSPASGSGRSAAAQSATVAAVGESRGGSPAVTPPSGGAEIMTTAITPGKMIALTAPNQASGGREESARGALYSPSPLTATERLTPASLNWLCDSDELFSTRQQQQQRLSLSLQPQQQQQHYSSSSSHLSPSKKTSTIPLSLPSSTLGLRTTQGSGHQLSQLISSTSAAQPHHRQQMHMSEPYLQLDRQQRQLEAEVQQQQEQGGGGRGQEGGYASIGGGATGGCEDEEENIAIQRAIQESLLTCPSVPSPRQIGTTASGDAAGERAANGGGPSRKEDLKGDKTQEEDEQFQQQYGLHSPSSSRLLSLPTTAALSTASGYMEDISELLLPPPQQSQPEDECRQPQQEKKGMMQQQQHLLQQRVQQPIQQEREEKGGSEYTGGCSVASLPGSQKVLRGRKTPTDRCIAPLSWIKEEEAEEASSREGPSSSFSSSSLSSLLDNSGVYVSADAVGENEGVAGRTPATDEDIAAATLQHQQHCDATDGISSSRSESKIRKTRRNEENMRTLLLNQMQPLPAAPDLKELLDVVFGEEGVNREIDRGDFSRWFHHPFLFAGDVTSRSLSGKRRAETAAHKTAACPIEEEEEDAECRWLVNSSTQWKDNAGWCSWGLVQLHGGPCGLLAAVQCFLLRALLFSPGRVKRYTRLLMLQRRQRQLRMQQQTQHQQHTQTQQHQQTPQQQQQIAQQLHETPQQQQQENPQQQNPQNTELFTRSEKEQDEELDSAWVRGEEEQQDAGVSPLSDNGKSIHQSIREGQSSKKATKCNGQEEGDWNVELLSLLPSPLTRRHALVEAVAAVIYQSTPASLYTVAYVLPADVEYLQQPAVTTAEETDPFLLLNSNNECTSNGERRRGSSSRIHVAATKEEGTTIGGAQGMGVGVDIDETESNGEAERQAQEIQENGRKEGVSEMLEDVRVYVQRFTRIEDVMHFYNKFYEVLLARETGVISFLFSVLLTRGIQQVINDMDMPGHSLIGVYGHCSQDLVNLLLLGAASSNVFDGDRKFGSSTTICATTHNKEQPSGSVRKEGRREGRTSGICEQEKREKMTNADEDKEEKQMVQEEEQTHLKGVRKRPLAGFLSEMEALRYCEVGSRYKHPHFPLWVVGSSNHYATLFSRDLLAAAVPSARLAEIEAQAAFRDFDRDGNFLILTEHLAALLTQLGQQERLIEAQRATCAAEGVVLLSDFLKWYSKIVMQQRSQLGEDVEPPEKFTLYIYDGQTPPGPSLRRFLVEASSGSSSNNKEELQAGEMRRLLSTRWPAAAVSELPLLPLHLSTNA